MPLLALEGLCSLNPLPEQEKAALALLRAIADELPIMLLFVRGINYKYACIPLLNPELVTIIKKDGDRARLCLRSPDRYCHPDLDEMHRLLDIIPEPFPDLGLFSRVLVFRYNKSSHLDLTGERRQLEIGPLYKSDAEDVYPGIVELVEQFQATLNS